MKVEIRTYGDDNSPARVLRKWVLIGAVAGALVVGFFGAFLLAAVMVAGALVGAVVGVLMGIVKAALALIGR